MKRRTCVCCVVYPPSGLHSVLRVRSEVINDELAPLLLAAAQTPLFDVRAAAFALCGDLAAQSPASLEPILEVRCCRLAPYH